MEVNDGLSHHGDPEVEGVDAEEPEVEVLEEPEVEVLEEGRPEDGREPTRSGRSTPIWRHTCPTRPGVTYA